MIRFLLSFFFILILIGCGSKTTPNKAPTAKLVVSDTTIIVSNLVTLDGASSSDSDGKIIKYSWSDQNGLLSSNSQTTWRAPDKDGNYILSLTVTDDDGATDKKSIMIVVKKEPNIAPAARLSASKNPVFIRERFTLFGSSSTDTDGNITEYKWLDETNSTIATTADVNVTISTEGNYPISLIVTDNLGASDRKTIMITVTKPTGPFGTIKSIINSGNATYICVGDSTRAAGAPYDGGHLFNRMKTSLDTYNVDSVLLARAGREAKQFNEANDSKFPTWRDVVNHTPSNGDTTIVDISLGINDLFIGTDIKTQLQEAIAKIRAQKPNTHFMLTMPNPQDPTALNNDGTYDQLLKSAYTSLSSEMGLPLVNVIDSGLSFVYQNDTVHFHMVRTTQEAVADFILSKILP